MMTSQQCSFLWHSNLSCSCAGFLMLCLVIGRYTFLYQPIRRTQQTIHVTGLFVLSRAWRWLCALLSLQIGLFLASIVCCDWRLVSFFSQVKTTELNSQVSRRNCSALLSEKKGQSWKNRRMHLLLTLPRIKRSLKS